MKRISSLSIFVICICSETFAFADIVGATGKIDTAITAGRSATILDSDRLHQIYSRSLSVGLKKETDPVRVSGSTGEAIKFLSTDFKNVRTNFHVVENPNTIHIRSIQYASRRADKVGFFVGVTAGVGGFLLSPSVLLITELKSKGRAAWVADEGGMFCLNAALAVGFYFLAKGVYNTWFRDGVYQRAYQYAQDNPVVTDPDRND